MHGKREPSLQGFASVSEIDKDAVEAVVRRRFGDRAVRHWWLAESPALGGLTTEEAFDAGFRLEVMELALGQPGNPEPSTPLISRAQAADAVLGVSPDD